MLQVKLSPAEAGHAADDGITSIAAHDLVLRGRERFFEFTPESSAQAKAFYRQALEIDPNYAGAHSLLASTYLRDWGLDWERDRAVLDKALEHAKKAVELGPKLPAAHSMLGWAHLWNKHGAEAVASGRRAVELDQNNADARLYLSFALASLGHGEEALMHIELALRLNPHPSAPYLNALALCHYLPGNYEQAIAANERGVEINPGFLPCLRVLVVLYALAGRLNDARRTKETLLQRLGNARPVFPSSFFLDPELAARYERDRKSCLRGIDESYSPSSHLAGRMTA